jgi:endonuclease/exonuclease/phosphatase family metal-dependent hydrolase
MMAGNYKKRAPRNMQGGGFFRNAIRWSGQGAVIFIVLWLCVWAAMGDSIAYLGYINAMGMMFASIAIIAGIALAFCRSWIWSGAAFVIGFVLIWMGSGLNFGASSARLAVNTGSMRIVSASVRGLNKDMAGVAERVLSYNPDIIAVQEASDAAALHNEVSRRTQKPWYSATYLGFVVLARKPVVLLDDKKNAGLIEVRIDNGTANPFRLWNIHAPKNFERASDNTNFYIDLIDNIRAKKPDFVVGDFNASPWNYGYKITALEMDNAHAAAGFGPGNSFPARGRAMGLFGAFSRIDHIFVDRKYTVINAFTGSASNGADHHPVIADVVIPKTK